MTLSDKGRAYRAHFVALAALLACGATGALVATTVTPREYSASSLVFLHVQSSGVVGDLLGGSNFLRQQIDSYAAIVPTPLVLNDVVGDLRLTESARQLRPSIETNVPLNSTNLEIVVTRNSPEEAALIANSVTKNFESAMSELAAGGDQATQAQVGVTVLREAVPPANPSSPNLVANLAIGILISVTAWVGILIWAKIFKSHVRSREELAALSGAPVLGALPRSDGSAENSPVEQMRLTGSEAEAYRSFRTNLRFLQSEDGPVAIAISSARPKEGKSTVAINLAMLIADTGLKVVLVDANLRARTSSWARGLHRSPGFTEVLAGSFDLESAIRASSAPGLSLLPSGAMAPNPTQLLASPGMRRLIQSLKSSFDVVIVDAPAFVVGPDAVLLGNLVDNLILVSTPQTRVADLEYVVESLERVEAKISGVVLNKERRSVPSLA
jgi:succinoglycan biosynthesis transport protein ExoP